MNILLYGAGVIASIFGAKLAQAGISVTLLARGKRYHEIVRNGIILKKGNSTRKETTAVKVIDHLPPDDLYDYIIVCVQAVQINDILPVLAENRSPNIVLVCNNVLGYDKWQERIGKERLLIGFPSAGGERKDGIVTYFIGKGLMRVFQTTTFGKYDGKESQRLRLLIKLFCKAGIPSVSCSDMDAWQKTHVALVTSIANALYQFDCNNYKLGRSYTDVRDMVCSIKEGFRVLKSLGVWPTPKKLRWLNLPTPLLTLTFSLIMRSKIAEITMAKHCMVAKEEMLFLQQDFDKLIIESNVSTPTIDKLRGYLCSV